jgi:hypothetical protein
MKMRHRFACCAAALACMLTSELYAQQLITNGGFESGFTGWTRVDQTGSDGGWSLQSGTSSPVNAFAVPAPPGPSNAAMTDAQAGGSHVLYQDFVVPLTLSVATLQFDLYINNHANAFFSPGTLDFSTPTLNQQVRVDIMTTSADPFSVAVADVLLNVFQTQPGNPLVTGYTTMTADLTALLAAHPGETLRLRFAEVDNVNFLNAGVDRVSLAVPEPSAVMLLLAGSAVIGILLLVRLPRRR